MIVFSAIMILSYLLTVSTINVMVLAIRSKHFVDKGWKARFVLFIVITILVLIYKFGV